MRYNLCQACVNLQPALKTRTVNIPRSCKCSLLSPVFGKERKGFPLGVDIIHCDEFQQYPAWYGDVFVTSDGVHGVGYVLTRERKAKEWRVDYLYDNSKNLKIVRYEKKSRNPAEFGECPY